MLTCNQNYKNKMIDCILCTKGILLKAYVYDTIKHGINSDHLQVWADFSRNELFGAPLCPEKPYVDRLNVDDPRVIEKC